MIVAHDEIALRVKALYLAGGLPRGSSPGWPSLEKLYNVALAQWTLITGTPGSGKSEFLDAVMVNLAKRENWKFVIFSPENWPLELHHSKIVEKYLGKPFGPGITERLTWDELDEAETWMQGKFFFAQPDQPDIPTILAEATKFTGAGNFKIGVIIDPWNHLEHYRVGGMSMTEYVSMALSEIIQWVRKHNTHLWLVAHPAKMQKDKEGKLPVPTPHDVSDSAHFWNKADNCITVWRNQSNYMDQQVEIHVQKIRFKHVGHIGLANLRYDRVTGRYYEALSAVPAQREPGADC